MAGKITDLTALASGHATGDLMELVDISDTTMSANGTNKKTTLANLFANIPGPVGGAPYPAYTLTTATGQAGSGTSGIKVFSNGVYIFDASVSQANFSNGNGIIFHGSRAVGWTSGAADAGALDAAFARKAAGVTEANNGTKGSYTGSAFGSGSQTVAQLPAAATAGKGARSFVTDASATTFLSTVAGGGANNVPVVSDGTNWLIG